MSLHLTIYLLSFSVCVCVCCLSVCLSVCLSLSLSLSLSPSHDSRCSRTFVWIPWNKLLNFKDKVPRVYISGHWPCFERPSTDWLYCCHNNESYSLHIPINGKSVPNIIMPWKYSLRSVPRLFDPVFILHEFNIFAVTPTAILFYYYFSGIWFTVINLHSVIM